MVLQWEPDTQYNYGAVVLFEGVTYQIVEPHRSQADWIPPITPALWTRTQETVGAQPPQPPQYPSEKQGYQPTYGVTPTPGQDQPPPPQGGYKSGDVHVTDHEQKKSWWELDEKRKKELELGGGLAAGAGLLAAAGYYYYKSHSKSDEEKKAHAWSVQNWLQDAKQRTDHYQQYGPSGPTTWILNTGNNIPAHAIQGGQENGNPLYISRAYYEGGLQIGKAGPHLQSGSAIGFRREEIAVGTYEILIGNERSVRWIDASGSLNVQRLGATPVEGGREDDGTLLYIAQVQYNGGIHPGKASHKLDGAYIPYGGTEMNVKAYKVLCYA